MAKTFIRTADLADSIITSVKLASLSVSTAKIQDAAITSAKLATNSVTADAIATGAVGRVEIANAAIDSTKIDLSGEFDYTPGKLIVASPSASGEVANKSYVDTTVSSFASGITWKKNCRVATTANVDLSSGLANGQTVDGVTVATGDRILVWKQTDAKQNGIYVAPASGAASRAADFDAPSEIIGAAVIVVSGTANANEGYIVTNGAVVVGTNDINFTQFTALGQVIAGNGLEKDANNTTLSIKLDASSGLAVSGTGLKIDLLDTSLELDSNGIRAKLGKGLTYDSTGIYVKTANGVQVDGSGFVSVKLNASNPALVADGSGLSVQVDGSDAIEATGTGLKLKGASVTTAKLGDGAVTAAKLASDVISKLGRFDVCKSFVATDAQTDFGLTDTDVDGAMGGHLVFVNGRLMLIGSGNDYTFADRASGAGGDAIVFEYGLVAGDVVVVAYGRTGV
jgi:hypothetical protein